jgi:diguanylate cyclase (GGDEF)-like protein
VTCVTPTARFALAVALRRFSARRRWPKLRLRCSFEPEAALRAYPVPAAVPAAVSALMSAVMPVALPQPLDRWLFGADPKQRVRVRRTLLASAIYLLAALAQWWAARIGLADPALAGVLIVCLFPGMFGFYLLLRSGGSGRFADPACTLQQMVFAIVAMAAAYVINPPLRGMLLMLVALVLMFAAFMLDPRASRALGFFAVISLALVMLAMASHAPQVFDPTIERIHFAFAAVVLPTVSMLAGELSAMRTRLKRQRSELVGALERIHKLATRDDLTGLVNRRHMTELAAMEQRRALRSGTQPCLCLVDIDHFKRINDQHGHGAGDEVLRLFSRHACAAMRETDVLARWGGEEFLVLMPDTRADEARTGIERLRRVLARDDAWGEQAHLRVSFSAGLTAWRPGEPLRDALARADDALYAAKAGGRDRLVER